MRELKKIQAKVDSSPIVPWKQTGQCVQVSLCPRARCPSRLIGLHVPIIKYLLSAAVVHLNADIKISHRFLITSQEKFGLGFERVVVSQRVVDVAFAGREQLYRRN